MGLYNIVLGHQPDALILVRMLELNGMPGLRLRDAWLNPDGTRIIVLTRNGGNNRQHDSDLLEYGQKGSPGCSCIGCAITHRMPLVAGYVRDWDDDFDNTYAYVEFAPPPDFFDWCARLKTGKEMPGLKERFEAVIADLGKKTTEELENDPRVKPIVDQLKNILK